MTIETREIVDHDIANMDQALCFTHWSAGHVIHEIFHGYAESEPLTEEEHKEVYEAAVVHECKFPDHNIVVYQFKCSNSDEG